MQEFKQSTFGGNGFSGSSALDLGELKAPSATEILALAEKAQREETRAKKEQKEAIKAVKAIFFDPCACW